MIGGGAASNLCKSLEHSHHAWPVLSNESHCLSLDLFIVDPTGKDRRDDDADHGQKKIVILSQGIRIVNVYLYQQSVSQQHGIKQGETDRCQCLDQQQKAASHELTRRDQT